MQKVSILVTAASLAASTAVDAVKALARADDVL
jgi:hypothetical protein